ncbi:DNA alkylation repair protein [Janthinobacterium agaricidamnosum]|uniref:DNA-3-methylpurine glycosylase n=1 Tax=Janthinobacterium agaricidamnosum NBRC 102515 = DSM 9628 TaxID=1349767 RepID=W0V111_9BURK|nr:DNA alkylation repair protein [Janthinobacterium agaricidamnosum]CDG80962.1 DNA-3-methylpurine glycosylase [Janthinobacterium agaricidamnosum NBRC 102515 = DSM 9628]
MTSTAAPALKDALNHSRFEQVAVDVQAVYPAFDAPLFLQLALPGLAELSLLQRVRRMSQSLRATLPQDYPAALDVLRRLIPRIRGGFTSMVPPDFVSLYGLEHFELSMAALKFFTGFGTSEFAVRAFLLADQARALAIMEGWSRDDSDAVRRLASEGCRPRLPWSFRLDALVKDPSPVASILDNLHNDSSLYVRKSVANHLNDISKDHPDWLFAQIGKWPLEQPHTRWIVKHALRTLIKQGEQRALSIIGAGAAPQVALSALAVEPRQIRLGDKVTLSFQLQSTAAEEQRLVVDYIVHYVKKSGAVSAKVFKLKEVTLPPGQAVTLSRAQSIRDFTTRIHHPGRHDVEVVVNGLSLGKDFFELSR